MRSAQIRVHSAHAAISLDGRVLQVTMSGPVTAHFMQGVKAQIVKLNPAGVAAFVVDYSCAVVAMSGEELDRVLEGEIHGGLPALPAALVSPAEQWRLWLGHCDRMARRGITRRIFSEPGSALAWAREEAALDPWPLPGAHRG